MDDDYNVAFELSLFASNIKKEVCGVSDSCLSFPKKYDEIKTHNMFLLMLNSQFMNFCFMFSFVGCEEGISIVEVYDKESLHLVFLKCYHCLYLWQIINWICRPKSDEDYNME
jgi:hypothetical protein